MTSPNGESAVPSTPDGGSNERRSDAGRLGHSSSAEFAGVSNPPTPARLTVGIVSAGRVGTALGEALERVGHVVGAVVARSPRSRQRATQRLPESQILDLPEVVARSELLIIAVPDADIRDVVADIADSGRLRPRTLVLHTAGAHGVEILAPLTALGALPLAVHPAMTFVGSDDDTARLQQACFGVTAADEVGLAIASALVLEMGGEPVRIAEADRTLYHAALAHGANHLVALVCDAVAAMNAAIEGTAGEASRDAATVDGNSERLAERILAPLLTAALHNVLDLGPDALTGPVARGDAGAVADHLAALRALPGGDRPTAIAEAYRILARRAATYTDAPQPLIEVLERRE
ncbi:DUF2520 domain-containing protein [Gordonia otitidis]|uniref:Rossmann-like and DUF2520 domain-containing protein n=1 Tax=Gordonia otitidis TaxID=249058 RepID=UPI001D14E502|nr:DUF2520 domain-containing protein [Gordonia otitidis]UEA57649.1 DUF2520 domain-containing protein [Gordonia otitidis]